jgi:hypothetical protein
MLLHVIVGSLLPLALAWGGEETPLLAKEGQGEVARNQVAQQLDLGESGPEWLVESETYAIGVNDWDALAQSKVAFATHVPVNRDYFARLHALGIRAFPYVTFYQGFAYRKYEDVNLREHADWIEVDENGNLKRTGFWESEDAKNMYTICPNTQGYQDAMVAWVEKLMQMGADGVFVDNLGSRAPCYGPQFGKHEHLYDDQNHAFAMLLKRVREVIQRYRPDGAILGNSAWPPGLPKEYWKYLDAEMLESYICTWVSKERWFDWHERWNAVGKELQPFLKAGKQIQALSYVGFTPYGVKEDSFFCYVTARLAGFVWSGGSLQKGNPASILYQIRLGKPLTEELESNGVHYRVFEAGLVALNPDKEKAAALPIGPPIPTTRLYDLAASAAQGWSGYAGNGYTLVRDAGRGTRDAGGGTGDRGPATTDQGTHSGERALRCENRQPGETAGASQGVTLNQTEPRPLVASGWSKAENVSGEPDSDYSLYLDLGYADGTYLYGQVAKFTCGTHDWEQQSVTIRPEKPVKSLTYYALFRGHTGTVWFDDVSLKEIAPDGTEREVLRNGGFEEESAQGRWVDVSQTNGQLEVPAFSGRVYLFGSPTDSEVDRPGPCLTVITQPGLGEVRFRVDGFDFWTYSGRWTTEYVLGPDFGKFMVYFDGPGTHQVEVVDVVPADMKTPAGYGAGERLGQFMDPANPTQPSAGRKYRFRQWSGPVSSTEPAVEVEVQKDTTLMAEFDVEEGK